MSEKQYTVYSAMDDELSEPQATLTFTDGKLTKAEMVDADDETPNPFWPNVLHRSTVDSVAAGHTSSRLVPVDGSTS